MRRSGSQWTFLSVVLGHRCHKKHTVKQVRMFQANEAQNVQKLKMNFTTFVFSVCVCAT